MGELALKMIEIARNYQNNNDETYYQKIAEFEDKIDEYDHSIHDYLMEIQSYNLTDKYKQIQLILLDSIRDFERIADHAVNLSEFYKNRYELNCNLSGNLLENLNHYFDLVLGQVKDALVCCNTNDKKLAKKIFDTEAELDRLEKLYRRAQLLEINENKCECSDLHYVDILANLERVSDHCMNLAENVIDPHYLSKERVNPS